MPSKPASSKRSKKSKTPKMSRPLSSPKQITKYLSGSLRTFNASPIGTLPMPIPRMLTFNASPLSSTKRRHNRAAKKLQGLFRGHMARKMTKKISSAAKKLQAFIRGRSARRRTGRMRNERREKQQQAQQKRAKTLSREMARLGLTTVPSTDGPRTTRSSRQLPSYRKNYKE